MATAATAVKPTKEPKEKKAKPPKAPRVDFKTVAAPTILSPNGTLTTSDVFGAGYDPKVNVHLKKVDFAEEHLFAAFKGHEMKLRGAALVEKGDKMIKNAETIKQFGDPKKRSKAKRMQKLAESLAELRKQLLAEGVDVDALLAKA